MIITATLCYLQQQDQTLMLYRNKKPNDIHEGKWNGIGGKSRPGESPEECARREIIEETGLVVDSMIFKGILTFPNFDGNNDWIVFVFVVQEFHGEVADCNEGELHWIRNSELMNLPLWEGDRVFIPLLSETGFFSGKFVYKDGRLLDYSVSTYS